MRARAGGWESPQRQAGFRASPLVRYHGSAREAAVTTWPGLDPASRTPNRNSRRIVGTPSWSSDGFRIAFVSDRDGSMDIYVMSADGGGVTRLTANAEGNLGPKWCP